MSALHAESEAAMCALADALERAAKLRDDAGLESPGRHLAVAVTHLQTAALWLAVADAELRGVQVADQVILDSLRGI